MHTRRNVATIVAALAVPLGSVTVGTIALAAPTWAAGCGISAATPVTSGSNVKGTGSRSGTCGATTFTVRVRKNENLSPDNTVGQSVSSGFKTGSLTAAGGCSKYGYGSYHTDASASSGGSAESGVVNRCTGY